MIIIINHCFTYFSQCNRFSNHCLVFPLPLLQFLVICSYVLINPSVLILTLHFFVSLITEFLEVGKKQPALDVLYDVIKSKKHRTWQKIHEPIMLKYLELCVDLRKSHLAKEGLYQYKNICQQVNTHGIIMYSPLYPTWNGKAKHIF